MTFSDGQNMQITVTVDGVNAQETADKLNESFEKLQNTAQESSGFSSFESRMISVNQALELGQKAFGLMRDAVSSVFDLLERADQIEPTVTAFQSLSGGASAAEASLAGLREATGGAVTDFDLMKTTTRALSAGLGELPLNEIAEQAGKLGEAMGMDVAGAYDKVTNALIKGNARQLISLGIIVDAEAANESYAESLGTTADKLSDAGKLEAQRIAILEKLKTASEAVGEVVSTAAGEYEKLEVNVQNLTDKFALQLSKNNDLRDALKSLNETLQDIDVTALAENIGTLVSWFIKGTEWAIKFADAVNTALFDGSATELIESRLVNIMHGLPEAKTAIPEIVKELDRLKSAGKANEETFIKMNVQLTTLRNMIDKTGGVVQEHALKQFELLRKQVDEYGKDAYSAAEATDELTGGGFGSGGGGIERLTKAVKEAAPEVDKFAEAWVGFINELEEMTGAGGGMPEARAEIDEITRAQHEGTITAEEAMSAYAALAAQFVQSEGDLEGYREEVELSIASQQKLSEAAGKLGQDLYSAFGGDSPLGEVLSGDFFKGLEKFDFSKIFGSFGEGVNGFFGKIFGAFSGPNAGIYTAIFQQFMEAGRAANDAVEKARGENPFLTNKEARNTFDDAWRGSWFDIFGMGDLAGPLREFEEGLGFGDFNGYNLNHPISWALEGLGFWGSNDEAEIARGVIRDWFQEVFDANEIALVIDGQFQQLEGLNFSEGMFNGFWEGLDTSMAEGLAQFEGFSGIGTALTALLSDQMGENLFESLGNEQLGAILGSNLQTLNNLQILMGELGISSEELGTALENAWLDGNIKAGEYLKAMQAVENIAKKGIPDGIGMTSQAFDNLVESTGNGRLVLDALIDLSAEASERTDVTITTLDQLRQELINSGKDADKVNALFDAIAASGITTLEELENISVSVAASVAAQLEGIPGFFAETQESLQQLRDDLDKIKDKEINIDINLRTHPDSNTEKYSDVINGDGGLPTGDGTQ